MKKIPTLFVRDPDNMKLVTDKVVPGLEWVLDGTCTAREKLDGTACAVLNGRLYKRFTIHHGWKDTPGGFIPSDPRENTEEKWPGWMPVGDGPDDRWHREAQKHYPSREGFRDGTYELVGPKVQGNPYSYNSHHMMRHDATVVLTVGNLNLSFDEIRTFLSPAISSPVGPRFIEGLVFWGSEGPVAKIKRRDFGFPWPIKGGDG